MSLFELAAVVVGAALVVAGASKLAMGSRWSTQAVELGTPPLLAPVVPWIELVLGATVAVQLALPWTALAAVVVLVAFTGLLLVHLEADRHPPCACFGGWSSRPLSWRHVARNAVLIALAALAAFA